MLGNGTVTVEMLNETLDIIENKFNEEIGSSVKTKHKSVVWFLGSNTGAYCIFEWRKCYEVIKGICEGLYYLHVKHRIIHLDLKPANILLDDNMVQKIVDFNFSRCFDEKKCRGFTLNLYGTMDCLVGCLTKAKHKNMVRFLGYYADTHAIIGYEVRMLDVRQRLLCFEYIPNGSFDKGCSVLSIYLKKSLNKGCSASSMYLKEVLISISMEHLVYLDGQSGIKSSKEYAKAYIICT